METAENVSTPAMKMTQQQADADAMAAKNNSDLYSNYRAFVMQVAYFARDRPDLAEEINTLAHSDKMVVDSRASSFWRCRGTEGWDRKRLADHLQTL